MAWDRLQTVIAAIRRNAHRDVVAGAAAGPGAVIAIGAMEGLWRTSHYPLVIIPFATSILLVIGSPDAEPAQPRALIGGHVVATLVGLAMLWITGPQAWAAAAAVGSAVLAMVLRRWFSPERFIRRRGSIPCWWSPTTCPVLAGAVLLTAFAYVWHRWVRRRPLPQRWL